VAAGSTARAKAVSRAASGAQQQPDVEGDADPAEAAITAANVKLQAKVLSLREELVQRQTLVRNMRAVLEKSGAGAAPAEVAASDMFTAGLSAQALVAAALAESDAAAAAPPSQAAAAVLTAGPTAEAPPGTLADGHTSFDTASARDSTGI